MDKTIITIDATAKQIIIELPFHLALDGHRFYVVQKPSDYDLIIPAGSETIGDAATTKGSITIKVENTDESDNDDATDL